MNPSDERSGAAGFREYAAPWSGAQKVVSVLVLALLGGVAVGVLPSVPQTGLRWLVGVSLGLVLLIGLLSLVRGYAVSREVILVRRLFWDTRLPVRGLAAVEADPTLTRGSLRLLGNGGFLATTGIFWSRRLGRYRMLANDLSRAVLLRYPDYRIVLAPEGPEDFARHVRKLAGLPAEGEAVRHG